MDNCDLFNAKPTDVSKIFAACLRIDLVTMQIPSKDFGFISLAAGRMTRFMGQLECDGSLLQQKITEYVIGLTRHDDIRVALTGTYALANAGQGHASIIDRLKELVLSERRPDDHFAVTLRAIALRMLRRLDHRVAVNFADTPAFDEYAGAVDYWLAVDATRDSATLRELRTEREWLISVSDRRTN